MTKTFISIISILITITCIGQTHVDLSKIEDSINNPNSEFFYPTLLSRYSRGDTSLTLEQKRNCYFGYIFDKNYEPYNRPKGTDKVDTLLSKSENVDTLRIKNILDSTLTIHPFDLKSIVYRLRFSSERQECEMLIGRLNIIADAINSTGNGTSEITAFQIILLPHELLLIDNFQLKKNGKQALAKNNVDVIGITKNNSKIKKLYFDVSILEPSKSPKNVLFHQYYQAYLNMHKIDYEIDKNTCYNSM